MVDCTILRSYTENKSSRLARSSCFLVVFELEKKCLPVNLNYY